MVSFMLHWSVTLLFLFAVSESVSVGTADKPTPETGNSSSSADDAPAAPDPAENNAEAPSGAAAAPADADEGDVRAPPIPPESQGGLEGVAKDDEIEEIIKKDVEASEAEKAAAKAGPRASSAAQSSPPESAAKDRDVGGEALKACDHLIAKEIQHVNLYAGSPAEPTEAEEGGQHETVTDSQKAGAKAVWGDLIRCVTHVAALGSDLQNKLNAERNLNVGYAEQYTKVLESLRHLQGPDMLTAFEKDTKETKADYNKQLDGIDKQLEVFKGYTKYGSSADRAHQEGDKRALLREVHSQSGQTSEEDSATETKKALVENSGTFEKVDAAAKVGPEGWNPEAAEG